MEGVKLKKTVRKDILFSRNSLKNYDLKIKSKIITQKFLDSDFYINSDIIMVYINFGSEVITRDIIDSAFKDNKRVVIPISNPSDKSITVSEITSNYINELEVGTYGVLEPKKEFVRKVEKSIIDIILIPGVAFDLNGWRIGYGAGYYDRFLKTEPFDIPKLAVSFDIQLIDNAYHLSHDVPVDYIITETLFHKAI